MEGESGKRGKGRQEGVGRGKRGRVPRPFNISPASKHSNSSTSLKNFFLLSPSPLLPSLQAFKFIILDKLNSSVTTSCIESQTKPYNNYSCKPELGRGKGRSLTWATVTHLTSCILFLTLLPMQAIPLPLAKLSQ